MGSQLLDEAAPWENAEVEVSATEAAQSLALNRAVGAAAPEGELKQVPEEKASGCSSPSSDKAVLTNDDESPSADSMNRRKSILKDRSVCSRKSVSVTLEGAAEVKEI